MTNVYYFIIRLYNIYILLSNSIKHVAIYISICII